MLVIESKPVNLSEIAHHVESLYGCAPRKTMTLRCECRNTLYRGSTATQRG